MALTTKADERKRAGTGTVRLLFTCIGRRVELLRAFQRAAKALRVRLESHGADATRLSPGFHLVDRAHLVPRIDSGGYIDALANLVKRQRVHLLIPLLDPELPLIAEAAPRLAEFGCRAVISSPRVVRTCRDKLETYKALRAAGINTPQTWDWMHALALKQHRFPYFLKPRFGSAGKGNYVVSNAEELRTLGQRVPDPIVQEFVEGVEHTLDVYTGLDGRPQCVVPRRRLEVRTGEVSKALIVKDKELMALGCRVAEALGECRGVVTVQCIRTADGRIQAIEINPRLGGGAPLAIHAGADFPKWLLAEHLGRRVRINPTGFRGDVAMLRFDDSVFVPNATRKCGVDARSGP
jgi:carbamoyl-phosphate synthase large subunit